MESRDYLINVKVASLKKAKKELAEYRKEMQSVELSPDAEKQIESLTQQVEELEKAISKINGEKVDKKHFKEFTDSVNAYVDSINQSFQELYDTLKGFDAINGIDTLINSLPNVENQFDKATRAINKDIKKINKDVQSVKPIESPSVQKDLSDQVKNTEKVTSATKKGNEERKESIELIKEENKELEKQADITKDFKKGPKTRKKSKPINTELKEKTKEISQTVAEASDDQGNKINIDVVIPEDSDQQLKDRVASLVNSINATNPTINVGVRFVSDYNTRKARSEFEQIEKDLKDAMEFAPAEGNEREEYIKQVEEFRRQLLKALRQYDSDAMFEFSTNIEEIAAKIQTNIKETSEQLKKFPLNADVILDESQVKGELSKMNDLSISIKSIDIDKNFDLSESFMNNLQAANELLKQSNDLKEAGKELTEADTQAQEEDTNAIIEKAKKINELTKRIAETVETIPLPVSFDKDQIQSELDKIMGLTLKIETLDVAKVKGLKGAGISIGGGQGLSPTDMKALADAVKGVDTGIEDVGDETKETIKELDEFTQAVDKLGQSFLQITDKGLLSQSATSKKGMANFIKGFLSLEGSNTSGKTLLDWMSTTKMLGEGDVKLTNAKIIEDALLNVTKINKVATPQQIASKLKTKKYGGLKAKGNEKVVEELFQSLIAYGVNSDAEHSFGQMLTGVDNVTLNELRDKFVKQYPKYSGLRSQVLMPSTPQKKVNKRQQRILDDNNAKAEIIKDEMADLNADIGRYLELSKVPLESVGKTLKERLDEIDNVDAFTALSRQFAKDKEISEEKEDLTHSIMHRISQMTPEKRQAVDSDKYGNVTGFIKSLEHQYPESLEKADAKREQDIVNELNRRFKRIEKDTDNRIVESEENQKAIDYFLDYVNETGKFTKKELKGKVDISDEAFKVLNKRHKARTAESKYNAMSLKDKVAKLFKEMQFDENDALTSDEKNQELAKEMLTQMRNTVKGDDETKEMTFEDVKKFVEEFNLPQTVSDALKEQYIAFKKQITESGKKETEKAKQVRIKSNKERTEEFKKLKETQQKQVETPARQAVEGVESIDTNFSFIQNMAQQASMPIDKGFLSEDNLDDVIKIYDKHIEKLAEIKTLEGQVNYLREQIVQEFETATGKKLTAEEVEKQFPLEEVLKKVFPESPENVKSTLTTLKRYDEIADEAKSWLDKIDQLSDKSQKVMSEGEKLESTDQLLGKLKLTKAGKISNSKANTEVFGALSSLYGGQFNVEDIRGKVNVPGLDTFGEQRLQERANLNSLNEELKKLSAELAKLKPDSKKAKELTEQKKELQGKIREEREKIAPKIEAIDKQQAEYEENFYKNLSSSYDEYTKLGEQGGEGYTQGFLSQEDRVKQAVDEVIKAGITSAEEAQDSHSPSREYYRLGRWAIEGYLEGIKENLPLIENIASQIQFNPDGSIVQDPDNVAKANTLISALKNYGAIRVARKSPMEDLLDSRGNIASKGLNTLFRELPKTAKTGQVQKSDISNFKEFFDRFVESYGVTFKDGKLDASTLTAVLQQMGVKSKDINIMLERFHAYIEQRAADINKERDDMRAIVNDMSTNNDGTLSKNQKKKYKALYEGYIKNYKNPYSKQGINDEAFNKFSSDMGLSEENALRVKEVFTGLHKEMYDHIEQTRQQCVDAVNTVSGATKDAITENGALEQNVIEKNEDDKLQSVEAEKKAQTQATEAEAKERQKLIEDLEKVQKQSAKYMSDYRDKVAQTIEEMRKGGDLRIGQDVLDERKSTGNLIHQRGQEEYYNILGGVNRLMSNKNLDSGLRAEIQALADALKEINPASEISQEAIKNLNIRLKQLQAESEKAGKTFLNTIVDRLRKANADFFARYVSIHDLIRYFRTMISTITEYDTALTEMRKVSDESVISLKEYQKATFDTATALGTTAVQVQQSTADWMRLGETMEEASKSAVAATTLLNVSEFENINDATTALVAMSQAYKDLDKTEIIDVLNNIGNNYSIATDQLATALQASSAALMTQGNDLYEAAALVTAGNAIIQDASKTGTGIRTIALRIAGQKMGKEELEQELNELGEEVDEWVMQTESKKREVIMEYTKVAANDFQGVDILDANGNLKDTYHILLEISQVYKDIQEADKKFGTNRAQGLVEELAGKVRSNIAASILSNPEMLENVYNSAINSTGSAAEENAKYLDSIAGKTEQFKNELQELEYTIIDSEAIKDIIDLGTGALELLNQLIKKVPLLTGVVSGLILTIASISQGWFAKKDGEGAVIGIGKDLLDGLARRFEEAEDFISNIRENGGIKEAINKLFTPDIEFSDELRNEMESIFSNEEFQGIAQTFVDNGMSMADALEECADNTEIFADGVSDTARTLITDGVTSMADYEIAEQGVGAAADTATISVGLLNAAVSFGITIGIQLLMKFVTHLAEMNKRLEEAAIKARENIQNISSDLRDTIKTVDEVGKKYAELAQNVSNLGTSMQSQGSLSTDEYAEFLDISNQLAELFPQLQVGIDDNGNAILNLNDDVNTIVDSLQNLVDVQRELARNQMLDNAEDVFKQDKKSMEEYTEALKLAQSSAQGVRDALSGNNPQHIAWQMLNGTKTKADAGTVGGVQSTLMGAFGSDWEERFKDVYKANLISGQKEFDFSKLSEDDKAILKNYFEKLAAEYERDAYEAETSIKQVNADFAKYMSLALSDSVTYARMSKEDQKIIDSLMKGIDLSQTDAKTWDEATAWFENNFVYALDNVSDQKIKDKMYEVFANTSLTGTEKQELLSQILADLPDTMGSAYDENHPLVLYYQLQLTNTQQSIKDAVDHIYKGMTPQGTEDSLRMKARAESYVRQLTPEQINKLNSYSIEAGTINGLQDVYDLLTDIQEESQSAYTSIAALLSQDNPIREWDRERIDPDKAEALHKLYDEELKKAEEAGADLERTIYGNIDLNDRARLDWDEDLLEQYRDEIESWYKIPEDYQGAFEEGCQNALKKYDGLPIPEDVKEEMAKKDADEYATNFVNEFASEMANKYLGSTSTVIGSYDDKAFGGIGIAYSPLLQVDGKAVPLSKETINKYFNEIQRELSAKNLKPTEENILKLDSQGFEVDGRKISNIIADIGETAEKTSRTMHYLGTDGALGLVQQMIDEVEYDAPTWEQVREDLIGLAQSGKLDEQTFRDYKYFDEIIKALGLDVDVTDEEIKGMIDSIQKMSTMNATDRLSTAKADLDKLDSAYDQFKQGGKVDATALNEVQDSFAYLGEAYREFEEAVMTGQEDLQPYFDEMVTQYAIQEGLLQNLDEETKQWTIDNLVNAGVTKKSAEESVNAILENKRLLEEELLYDAKKLNTLADLDNETRQYIEGLEDLDNLDAQNIANLINETEKTQGLSEELKVAAHNLGIFALQKAIAEGRDLRNPDDLEYLWELIKACGLGAEALAEFEAAKAAASALDAQQKETQGKISNYETQMKKKYGSSDSSKWNYNDQSYYKTLLGQQTRIDRQREENADYIANWASNLASDYGEDLMNDVADAWSEIDPAQDTKLGYGGAVEDTSKAAEAAAKEAKDTLDKILAMYDAELDAGVVAFQTYVDKSRAIIEQYYNEGKITASEYYDYLSSLYEKQISEYDKVISAVQRKIKEQTDALTKEKEAIEESYNLQIEEIQNKIDALQEENDEIDRNIALQKAQYDLARMQHQRTRLMYSESRGFYYEADLRGIADAQENVRKAEVDKTVADLQRKITELQTAMKRETDTIDEQIKSLNEYAEEWSHVSRVLEESIEDQRAAEILGQDWEKQILEQRMDVLQDFTNQYVALQQAQKDAYLEARRAELEGGSGTGGSGGGTQKTYDKGDNNKTSGLPADWDNRDHKVTQQGTWKYNGKLYYSEAEANAARDRDRQKTGDDAYKTAYDKAMQKYKYMPNDMAQARAASEAEEAKKKALVTFDSNRKVVRATFTGTDSAKAGETLVGELGSEIVLDKKKGTATIVDDPTLMDLHGGEKIFNAEETEKILKSKYKPLASVNPKKFAMLHSFANGTSSPMQSAIAAQAVGIASGIKSGLVPALANAGGQTINQTFNVSLPNITDASKASDLFREFEQLQRRATQFFN